MCVRKPLIAANWKMYKTPAQSLEYLQRFLPLVRNHTRDDITLFPAIAALACVIEATQQTNVVAGAQTMHWLDEGAYTGQTSPAMLTGLGCKYVLLGHSERRTYTNETDEMVNRELKAAIHHGLTSIVCVGETLDQRRTGLTEAVLNWQVACAFVGCHLERYENLIIAYEPVWAIGTGSTASAANVQEAHCIIRKQIGRSFGREAAERIRLLYGGSVKPENIAELMELPDVDGALVGAASLDPEIFAKIVQYRVP